MMKPKYLVFVHSVLCLSLLLLSSCVNSQIATSEVNIPSPTLTPSITPFPSSTPTASIMPTASITPAIIIKPKIHLLALNENNIRDIENLATFGMPSEHCINSALDSAVETRFRNGQIEYLLATTDFESRNITLWNIETEERIQTFGSDSVDSILFTPDQNTLISFSRYDSGRLTLWDIENGDQRQEFFIEPNYYYDERISISQDGLRIAVFSCSRNAVNCQVSEFNLQTNKLSRTNYVFPLYGENPPPRSYSPKGNLISITYNSDNNLHFLDLTNRKDTILEFPFSNIYDIALAEAIFSTMAVSSNEKYVSGGALNGDIYIWDVADGSLLKVFQAHTTQRSDGWLGAIHILEFSPESNLLLSVGYDGFTKLWDVNSGVLLKIIDTCHHFGGFTQDGRYLITVGKNGIEMWGIPE